MGEIKMHVDEIDDKTLFTAKTLSFNSTSIQTPCKLFDLNALKENNYLPYLKELNPDLINSVNIIERSHLIQQSKYLSASNDPNPSFLKNYDSLKKNKETRDKQIVNSLTLEFNPFRIKEAEEYLQNMLAIYYEKTDILLIPNIKTVYYNSGSGGKKSPVKVIKEDEYMKYVDLAYDHLSFKNSKPIFIPLPLKYGIKIFSKTLQDYLSKGYRYFWIDFEGGAVASKMPQIRRYHQIVDQMRLNEETVLYGSNVRRERISSRQLPACPAGDIVSAPLGIDIIGVNRSPKAWPGANKDVLPPTEKIEFQARLLDRDDYSYVHYSKHKTRDELLRKYEIHPEHLKFKSIPRFFTNVVNTFEMNEELSIYRQLVQENKSLLQYLGNKKWLDKATLKGFEKVISKSRDIKLDMFL